MGRKTNDEESSGGERALYTARDKVIAAMPGIIDKIIEKARQGSYLHAKFLLEFARVGQAVKHTLKTVNHWPRS